MAKHRVEDVRTVALVGHEQAGKTTLADDLLFKARAVERRGSVDDGTSVSDFEDEEKRVKYSIDTSVLHLEYKGKLIHLLDAPGKPEFVGAALGALNAVDTAIIVINGAAGIQVNTRRMFQEAGKRGLGRVIVINKMDADNIHFPELLQNIQATFGKGCALWDAPIGQGASFTGDVDVFHPPAVIPAGCLVDVAAARARLVDCIVESDEQLMEKFLGEGDISPEELAAAMPQAIAAESVVPIFCTSAKKDLGVEELLDAIVDFMPSPAQAKKRTAQKGQNGQVQEVALEPKESGEFVAQVFKTNNDKFVGNLAYFRVLSGRASVDQPFVNLRTGKQSKTAGFLLMQGKGQQTVTEAGPGDIVAVAKVEDLHIGDTLGANANAPRLPKPVYPTPMYGLAVEPKARGDEQKISTSLAKIADEDPTFKVSRDAQTKEMVITGMSQLHLDTVQHRLKRRYDLEVITHEPKIPYRETITGNAEASHRHKKQSGGRGQFGEVHLRVYPLPREIDSKEKLESEYATKERFEKLRIDHTHFDEQHRFAFLDTVVGGSIPNQFIPAIEKGCKELLERGRWQATPSRTWQWRCSSARTIRWTARKRRSRRPAASLSRTPFCRRIRCCWSRWCIWR